MAKVTRNVPLTVVNYTVANLEERTIENRSISFVGKRKWNKKLEKDLMLLTNGVETDKFMCIESVDYEAVKVSQTLEQFYTNGTIE